MGFPWRHYTDRQLWHEFRRLVAAVNEDAVRYQRTGMACSDAFYQEERCSTATDKHLAATTAYARDAEMFDAFLDKCDGDKRNALLQRVYGWARPAQFPPAVAGAVYRQLNARHVLDPFAGWGDRCIAAMAVGCAYTGIDSNERLREPYERMVSFFGAADVSMIFAPCEAVDLDGIAYDCVFSCPPYYTEKGRLVEKYRNRVSDYQTFLNTCLVQVKRQALRSGAPVCYALPRHMQEDLSRAVGEYRTRVFLKKGKAGPTHKSATYMYIWQQETSA